MAWTLFGCRPRTTPARKPYRLLLERLEDRLTPTGPVTYHVTGTTDGPGVLTPSGSDFNDTTLRGAINAANADGHTGTDTIQLPAGHYTLTTGNGGALIITASETIQGAGTSVTLVDGGGTGAGALLDSDFVVSGAAGSVSFNDITIEGGHASVGGGLKNYGTLTVSNCTLSGNSANGGAGIENYGPLTVSNCTLSGNSASFGGGIRSNGPLTVSNCTLSSNSASYGAGIDNGGPLTVSNCTLSGNSASYSGGGIDSSGPLTVSNCTLSGNSASYSGGGIDNEGPLTVSNCTLSGNSATYYGGGIWNEGGHTLTVSNCTLSGNSSTSYYGGGIYNSGTLTVSNCTLSGNSASYGGGIINYGPLTLSNCTLSGNSATSYGGGIYNGGTLTLNNSIVANSPSGGDIVGGYTGSHDLTGSVALGSLANNGGPTQTLALLPNDGAIDQGGPDTTLSSPLDQNANSLVVADAASLARTPGLTIQIDAELMTITGVNLATNTFTVQRGVNRAPHAAGAAVSPATDQRGFPRQVGAAVDIGAFEVQTLSTFLKTDTATQGSWQGVYGTDGYLLAQGAVSLPAYAQVTLSGQSNFTWAASTSDVRALQQPGASDRLAATWYAATTETLDVNLTDERTHAVGLYLLDWDNLGRSERIDVVDANNPSTVLDTRTVSGFSGGQYLVWAIAGHVQFKITNLGGGITNAVSSGLFFGQAGVKADAATAGSWQGTYGTSGYTLAPQGPTALPAYATVNVAGGLPYTWAASTSDVRALQKPGASARLAACWYAPGSFTIDVNFTDGQSHPVALYLLDWDNAGRSERVEVLDQSNDVLYSSTVNAFSGGEWLAWTLAGHDTIRVTSLAGPNAVASGLFFGQPGAPQLAAGGQGPGGQGRTPLTEPELAPILAAAEDRLIASGLSAAEAQQLRGTTAVVTDLPAGSLGRTALGGSVVYLDATAAGYGWFIDSTPLDDSEFPLVTPLGMQAPAGSPAFGRMDLLTVVMHELEHVLGVDSVYGGDPADLMDAYLPTGDRRLPSPAAAGLAPSALAGAAGHAGSGASSPAAVPQPSLVAGPGSTASLSAAATTIPTPGQTASGFGAWTIPDWWFLSEEIGRTKQDPGDTDGLVAAA